MQFSENWPTSLDSPKSERKAWGSDWHFLSCDGWYEANEGKWEASSCWEPNLKPSIIELWPPDDHLLSLYALRHSVRLATNHCSVSAVRTLLDNVQYPPHPLACVQRERTCLEQSVYHTIQLFDHCANWTGGVWIQFIKVMYTQIYCFCFQNAIITKAILTSFSKPTSLNCSKYSCMYTHMQMLVRQWASSPLLLSSSLTVHSFIAPYLVAILYFQVKLCVQERILYCSFSFFLINHSGFRFRFSLK